MALATTTLSAAITAADSSLKVASATSMAAGRLILIDQEVMKVANSYVNASTTVPVIRGYDGSAAAAHVITANVTHGDAKDFSSPPSGTSVTYPAMRPVYIQSVTASSTLTLPSAGCDWRVILNGTSVINLVFPAPTKDMDGMLLHVVANGAAAHTIQFTGGIDAAGSNYDVVTNNATGQACLTAIAANGAWCVPAAPGITGTVTNITGGVA